MTSIAAIPADVVNHIAAYATSAEFISRKYKIVSRVYATEVVVRVVFDHKSMNSTTTRNYLLGAFYYSGHQLSQFNVREYSDKLPIVGGPWVSVTEFFTSVRNVLPILLEHSIEEISDEWKTQTLVTALKPVVTAVMQKGDGIFQYSEIVHRVQIPASGMRIPEFSAETNIRCKKTTPREHSIISIDVFGYVAICDFIQPKPSNTCQHPRTINDPRPVRGGLHPRST